MDFLKNNIARDNLLRTSVIVSKIEAIFPLILG